MKKVLLFVIILGLLFLNGCGIGKENYISKEKTNYVLIEGKASGEKSGWAVIDDFVVDDKLEEGYKLIYLKENHPELTNVKKVAEAFLKEVFNIKYNTVTGKEGTQFFSQRRLAKFVEQKEAEERREYVIRNKMEIETNGVYKYHIVVFGDDFTKCRVEVRPGVRFTAAEALEEGVELNKDYYQVTTLWMIKENDIWKIDEYKVYGLRAD